MSTIIIIKSPEQDAAVREVLESLVTDEEIVHFLRLPSVSDLGPLIQRMNPMSTYGIEYTINSLPDISAVVEFALYHNVDRICIGISERTLTGKARIDDLAQSLMLHEHISGDLIVGDNVLILEELHYGEQSQHT